MQIAVISDCHLNKDLYKSVLDKDITFLPFRTVDFMKSFEYMVKKLINKVKPDLLVIAGDVYDNFDPSNAVRAFFCCKLKELSEAKIPVIILVGNHDICRKHHALKPIDAFGLKGIKVIESPRMISFKDHLLMLFPFSMEVERGEIGIKDQFNSFISEWKSDIQKIQGFSDKKVLFFGHFGVKGAALNQYETTESSESSESSEECETSTTSTTTQIVKKKVLTLTRRKKFLNNNANDISLADLDEIGAEYVILGDYHQHQILGTKKCHAMYTGSIERTDMSEMDQSKGFVVYDSEAEDKPGYGKCSFIEYPNCRPMLDIRGTLEEIEDKFSQIDTSKNRGAIVKLVFNGNSEQLTSFSLGLDNFKKKLKAKIDPVYTFHSQNVIDEKEKNEASLLEAEILEHGHIEADVVLDVVEDMVSEKIKDIEERTILMKMATDFYKETMEEE